MCAEPCKKRLTLWAKEYINYSIDLEESIGEADFVIESAPEDLEIKRRLYSNITPFLKMEAIVASNTSTFPLATLAYKQAFAGRMLITHFFNPAHLIPLVEIVKTEQTIPGLAEKVAGFLSNCGKKPVVLKKDIFGFIANRLQAAVLREACFLLENDIADARQINYRLFFNGQPQINISEMMCIEILNHHSGYKCFSILLSTGSGEGILENLFSRRTQLNRFVQLKPRMLLYLIFYLNVCRIGQLCGINALVNLYAGLCSYTFLVRLPTIF